MNEQGKNDSITDEEGELLRSSFLKLIPNAEEASLAFYDGIFRRMPAVRGMFSQDIRVQGEKFMMMLAVMLDAIDKPAKLEAECKVLGTSHARLGVTGDMFDAVGESLLDSFSISLGVDFDDGVRASWAKLYGIARSSIEKAQGS